jgi:hypothetical protein
VKREQVREAVLRFFSRRAASTPEQELVEKAAPPHRRAERRPTTLKEKR